MTYRTTEYVEFFGEDFRAHIEFDYAPGCSAGYWDPGYAAEVNVSRVWLQRGRKGDAPRFQLTRQAFWSFVEQDWVSDACAAAVEG